MKLSLGLPHYGRESSPEVIARFAHEAEQLDYDAVWALERLLRPVKPRSAPFPGWTPPAYYANVYDPIETLTFVATKTRRIKLGTSVIDALFHVPVMLARRLATLDHFSAGRVITGLGQGWSADEFETANVPMQRRGAGFEDFIGALRAAWGPDPVRYDGRFYKIPESEIGPKPLQPGGPLLLIGLMPTSNGPAARAGRLGLGLHPLMFDWTELETLLRHFRTAASDAGQSAGPVIVRINDPVTETPVADRKPLSGAPEQIRDDLQRLQSLGVEGVMWDLTQAEVPFNTQFRLLERLRRAAS